MSDGRPWSSPKLGKLNLVLGGLWAAWTYLTPRRWHSKASAQLDQQWQEALRLYAASKH